MKRKLIAISFAIIMTGVISCTTSKSKEEPAIEKESKYYIDNFFADLNSRNEETVVNLLKTNSNLDLKDSSSLDLIQKIKEIPNTSGDFMEQSLINKRIINNDIALFNYLAKYDRKFYRFTFVFYNNSKKVKIFKLSFDESVAYELEEGQRLYLSGN